MNLQPWNAVLGLFAFVLAFSSAEVRAADPKPANAAELAAYLSTVRVEGANYIRAKMEIKPDTGSPATLQLQIKARRSARETAVVYQVLFPKERKGEAVLLRHSGERAPTGNVFTPPDTARTLDAAGVKDGLFGSDLSYEDAVDNFFAWERQTLVGTETVDGVNCQILESRPGKGEWSSYGSVKTWVDPNRLVPMRVEKYGASGQLVRRIDSTRYTKDDKGRVIPASLAVRRPGHGVTEIDGSRSEHGVTYPDAEFTADGIKQITAPPRGAE